MAIENGYFSLAFLIALWPHMETGKRLKSAAAAFLASTSRCAIKAIDIDKEHKECLTTT
jgi:hypothetical protein